MTSSHTSTLTFNHTRRACYTGFVTQAIVNNMAPLLFIVFQTRYNIPYEMLGRLVLANFATQMITDLVAVRYVDRIGYRLPLVLAHVLCVLGMVGLAVLPPLMPTPYTGLWIAIVIYAIGGGLLEVLLSPVVEALPSPQEGKAAAMSLLHSFYCWGQVLMVLGTTFLLAWVGFGRWSVLPLVWAVVPLVNLLFFLRVPLPPTVPDTHRTSLRALFNVPVFLAALLLMLCAGAAELTMSQWSSLFAQQGLGLPKVWGDIAGPCVFAVLMGVGRIVYGLWGERVPLLPTLAACGSLGTVCYLTAALSQSPLISLVGCAVCGLAVSLLWPGTFSLSAQRFPMGGAAMFAVLAIFGDMGAAFGPWLAGAVADATVGATNWVALTGTQGLRAGILVGTLFPLLVIVTAFVFIFATRRAAIAGLSVGHD